MAIKLNHPQQKDLTLEELQDDVNAVKHEMDVLTLNKAYAFTAITVQCLINKIKEQEEEKNKMIEALKGISEYTIPHGCTWGKEFKEIKNIANSAIPSEL